MLFRWATKPTDKFSLADATRWNKTQACLKQAVIALLQFQRLFGVFTG